jgi:hypothetical protein
MQKYVISSGWPSQKFFDNRAEGPQIKTHKKTMLFSHSGAKQVLEAPNQVKNVGDVSF